MTHTHFVGLDVGQSQDPTAIAVVEVAVWLSEAWAFELAAPASGWVWPGDLVPAQVDQARSLNQHRGRPPDPPLAVRHLERLPLGTPYPAVVERVQRLLATPPLRPETTVLIVDKTGVGAPIVDLLKTPTFWPVACTITAGSTPTFEAGGWEVHVPKRDLISSMAVLLENRRLKVADTLPEAATLVKELQAFRRRITPVGSDQYGSWREGQHDDLVLALALACWYREDRNSLIEQRNRDDYRPESRAG